MDELVARSLELIRGHQSTSGAYPASPSFEPYRYCWFRDGAFIADAMSRWGEIGSAEAFFGWCSDTIVRHADDAHLHARYTLEGEEAATEWPTFQLDGYGTWLWALAGHADRHGRSVERFRAGADLSAGYIAARWREPCTDWWEERVGTHPATLACIWAGLDAWEHAEAEAVREAALASLASARLDASLLVLTAPFRLVEPPTPIRRVEEALVSPGGGVHRHLEDVYYGGGEWLLLTAWLGWAHAEAGRTDEAREKLDWIARHATPEGHLPEQAQDHLLAPEQWQPWVDRWGPPASPLLWSHAMLLTLTAQLP